MSVEIIIFLVLIVVGGGIALFADWLGLTMGKKRLTLGGLRPRNTARLVTVIAGALIAAVSFGLLLLLNHDFEVAIRQGPELIERNYELRHQNIVLQRQSRGASIAAQQAQQQAAAEELRRAKAEKSLAVVNGQLTTEQSSLLQVRTKMGVVQGQLAKTTVSLGAARVELAQAKQQSVALAASNAEAQKSLAELKSSVLHSVIKTNQDALVYRYGAEIGRVAIQADLPVPIIQQQINSFLIRLSGQSIDHGASVGGNGRAVQVATVAILTQSPTKSGHPRPTTTFAGEQTNIEALAGQIHAYSAVGDSVVVIAKTAGNSFAGEQVYVTLSPYANRLVIRQGTVLGTLRVPDSQNDPDKILLLIQKQLIPAVHVAAMHAGVIPVVNPQLHEAQLGGVTLTDLYKLVDQVRHTIGDTEITVSAAQDTYSGDQLHLAFTVAKVPPAGG